MTTMHDLTQIVRAVVFQTAAAQTHPSPIPVAQNLASMPSTSAVPSPVQTTYTKVAQAKREQAKPPKLIPPAKYKREPTKVKKTARVMHSETRVARTDRLFFI